ncbi:MAG TPA: hypothetical protein VKB86_14770 [Pyrinomonadaceae bacterium]|nr:hypothetical protein [Pyrinomonadaceae bacterium]
MKKLLIAILLSLAVTMCVAQNGNDKSGKQSRPDLSGTWKLDKSKGNYVAYSGLKPDAELILVISHNEPEIKVTRKSVWQGQERVQEWTYYSDGRGEVGHTIIDGKEGESKTKWEGDKLVSRFSISLGGGRTRVSVEVTQELKVSANGKVLTQTERMQQAGWPPQSLPQRGGPSSGTIIVGPSEIKRVFNRIS